ncbi:diguanylate cyclase [Marinobacter sp. HL-58]|uniref:sensor domain-containing diguanylate cyclase n=1 Tax=Marinobacter sp. HL-58 TaxID=1479237 RepID=UPI00048004DC|nr:diguanylate cyclase [Marinobacter sp. HL-58]KPP96809.1 MAG: diguanylate cyclase (GGDEF) domain [Marinobacter sp. HL-58]
MTFPASCKLVRILLLALLLVPGLAHSDGASIAWLEAPSAESDVEDIRALPEAQWRTTPGDETLNFGFSDSSFWLRVEVPAQPFNRLLEIGYPLLDDVRVYWFVGDEEVERHVTGDRQVFDSRPIHHRNFVFLVPSNNETATAYIRVHSEGSVQIPVRVIASADFLAGEQLDFGWQALFLGIMIAMALYNLFVFVIVRHLAYLWYVLTVTASALVLLNFNGLVFQWLWPDLPVMNRYFTAPAISANIFFAAMFTLSFLAVRRYSPVSYRLLQMIVAISVGCFVYGLFGSYQTSVAIISVLAAIITPLTWILGLVVWFRGQVLAGFYVVAWTPLLLGHMVMAVSKIGLIPTNTLTEIAPQIGVALEVILLSFALAYRISLERQRRLEAQEHTLEVQRQANQNLEARVQARTEELEAAYEKLKAVSITDGLTQVANRRRFDEKLEIEWNRALRHGHPLGLVLLDIDHFKRVNDEFGHLAGDDCLVSVARVCAGEIQRSGDLLARYGGEEFCVLLPATPEAGAISVAERLRAAVAGTPVDVGEHVSPVNLSVSAGVAIMVPGPGMAPSDLVSRADEALYAAKAAGRNRVMVFRESGARAIADS